MKRNPIYGSSSPCHSKPSLIVRSREGGFLTQNCVECGGPRNLPFVDLPRLKCTCGGELDAFVAASKNYAYRCSTCSRSVELPELAPKWDERFEYHGFGLDSDYDGKAQPIRTI